MPAGSLTELGLAGDVVVDVENHGGLDQAVYLYCAEDYAYWEGELGVSLPPGSFGENLTCSSFGERTVRAVDPVEALGGGEDHPEIVTSLDVYYDPAPDPAVLRALLAAPVASRARAELEDKFARSALETV